MSACDGSRGPKFGLHCAVSTSPMLPSLLPPLRTISPPCRPALRIGFSKRWRRFWNQICTERGVIPSCMASVCLFSNDGSGSSSARGGGSGSGLINGADLAKRRGPIRAFESANSPKWRMRTASCGCVILHRLNLGSAFSRAAISL